jgi:two-component system, response regulator / RNA-binding antiterminator
MILTNSPDWDTVDGICTMSGNCPRPVVMFTDNSGPDTIRAAIHPGAASCVRIGSNRHHSRPHLNVARSRFQTFQAKHIQLQIAQRESEEKERIDLARRSLSR